MTGRGIGRGSPLGSSPAPANAPSASRRTGFPGVSSATAAISGLSVSTGAPARGGGKEFDPSRPTYRIPERFRDRSIGTVPSSLAERNQGSGGRSVKLTTNYFSMREFIEETYALSMFNVKFDPDVKMKGERYDLVGRMKPFLDMDGYFYDGRMNLFTASQKRTRRGVSEGPHTQIFNRKHGPQTVTVTFIKEIGDPRQILDLDMAHGVINQHLAKVLSQLGLIRIGEGFFNEASAKEVKGLQGFQQKLNIWLGYKPLLMQYDAGLLLNVDLGSKFVRTGTVYDVVARINPKFEVNAPEHCQALKLALNGTNVLTIYNKKAYKIKDVVFDKSANDTFERRKVVATDTEYVVTRSTYTIGDYLKESFGVEMKFKGKQPMLMCEPINPDEPALSRLDANGKRVFDHIPLIPEFCMLVGLTDDLRSNVRNMALILDACRKEPPMRYHSTEEFTTQFNVVPQAVDAIKKWALLMGQNLQTVDARELKTVNLEQQKKMITYDRSEADWTRSIRSGKLDDGQLADKVYVVFSAPQMGKADEFCALLQKVSLPMGMQLRNINIIPVGDPSYDAFQKALIVAKDADLVIAVLPEYNKQRYDAIKKYLCCEAGVPSQCVLVKNVDNKSAMSIATKIALQINAKLRGALWHIQNPAVKAPNTMVIGVASARDKKGTMLSFVGTTNSGFSHFASYAGTAGSKPDRQRIYQDAFKELFAEYQCEMKTAPVNLIVYRLLDGEEFMFDITDPKEGELAHVKNILRPLGYMKLLFCVAMKRCSTRFFTDKSPPTNPAAGTIVDSTITLPGRYDFFLISHNGRKGSVMPTYYFVVGDDTGITPEELQNFTFQLTHMYYNWSGTIKVPAVCQYALKMVTMCTEVTGGVANDKLTQSLWYL